LGPRLGIRRTKSHYSRVLPWFPWHPVIGPQGSSIQGAKCTHFNDFRASRGHTMLAAREIVFVSRRPTPTTSGRPIQNQLGGQRILSGTRGSDFDSVRATSRNAIGCPRGDGTELAVVLNAPAGRSGLPARPCRLRSRSVCRCRPSSANTVVQFSRQFRGAILLYLQLQGPRSGAGSSPVGCFWMG